MVEDVSKSDQERRASTSVLADEGELGNRQWADKGVDPNLAATSSPPSFNLPEEEGEDICCDFSPYLGKHKHLKRRVKKGPEVE
jgi:hypothetical protein